MANLNTKFQKDRDLASEEIDARIRDYKKDSSPKNWNALIDATFRVMSLSSLSKTKFYEVLEVLGLEIKVNDVDRYMDDSKELLKRGEKGIESNNTLSPLSSELTLEQIRVHLDDKDFLKSQFDMATKQYASDGDDNKYIALLTMIDSCLGWGELSNLTGVTNNTLWGLIHAEETNERDTYLKHLRQELPLIFNPENPDQSATNNPIINKLEILGQTITNISHKRDEDDRINEVYLKTVEGNTYRMVHHQDCCEDVWLHDVIGDWKDLIGNPLTMAEEVVNESEYEHNDEGFTYGDSHTWTFYKFATCKGYVTLRWYGESNGYYSEEVNFEMV